MRLLVEKTSVVLAFSIGKKATSINNQVAIMPE
jgi:hypothetical protein